MLDRGLFIGLFLYPPPHPLLHQEVINSFKLFFFITIYTKGECSVLKKKYILWMKTIRYPNTIKIPLGHSRINGTVYSKIYFKVEICSAH